MPETSTEAELREELLRRDDDRRNVQDRLNRERLSRVTGEMIQALTAPEFFEKVRAARDAADRGEGMDVAAKLMSIESLREAGVDIPEDFRMTSRVFEDLERGTRITYREEPMTVRGDPTVKPDDGMVLGWGGCAGGGGLTFCGCGGFST